MVAVSGALRKFFSVDVENAVVVGGALQNRLLRDPGQFKLPAQKGGDALHPVPGVPDPEGAPAASGEVRRQDADPGERQLLQSGKLHCETSGVPQFPHVDEITGFPALAVQHDGGVEGLPGVVPRAHRKPRGKGVRCHQLQVPHRMGRRHGGFQPGSLPRVPKRHMVDLWVLDDDAAALEDGSVLDGLGRENVGWPREEGRSAQQQDTAEQNRRDEASFHVGTSLFYFRNDDPVSAGLSNRTLSRSMRDGSFR